jgi:hypothetical protein
MVTRHCGRCQPHTVYAIACLACDDGPLLTGQLAKLARGSDPQQLPTTVTNELTRTGWRWTASPHATGWICCQPPESQPWWTTTTRGLCHSRPGPRRQAQHHANEGEASG